MSVVDIDDEDEDKWLDYARSLTPQERNEQLLKVAAVGASWRTEELLKLGADANHENGTALMVAAAGGHTDVLRALLTKDFDVERKSEALTMAVTALRPSAVKVLLQHHADPRLHDSVALWYTAMNGNEEMAHDLLQAGADVTSHSNTLMGLALSHRNDKVANELLHFGADPSATYKGRNAFEWAAEMHLEVFFHNLRQWVKGDPFMGPSFFESKTPAELRAVMPNQRNRTGLHMAASTGNFEVIRDTFIAANEQITVADLKHAPDHTSPDVLNLLGQTGQLSLAFDARLWAGRKEEMLEAFAAVPELYRAQVDIKSVASAIDQQALKSRAHKFSLKKPGP